MSLMLKLEKILNIENENRFGNCYKYAYYISLVLTLPKCNNK